MESISNYELIQLIQNALALVESAFQYWLSVSIAVVIASFIAKNILSRKIRIWISILYILASALFATRYFLMRNQLVLLVTEVLDRGVQWPTAISGSTSIRISIFVLGLLSALWFLNFYQSNDKDEI